MKLPWWRGREHAVNGRRCRSAGIALLAMIACTLSLTSGTGQAAVPKPDRPAAGQASPDPSTVAPADRDRLLASGWRSSADIAWTTSGDAAGFHLLVAPEKSGYTWVTAATLVEPGFDTGQWIGNACVTGSGKRAVVVYAPREFSNRAELSERGAFAAVVDLRTGAVTKLPVRVSLAYYSPGCGAGETVVLPQDGDADLGKTRLNLLDAATGRLTRQVTLSGQVTSAVPQGGRVVAARGAGLVSVDWKGHVRRLAATHAAPFAVHPDGAGGVVFLDRSGGTGIAERWTSGGVRELARGSLTGLDVTSGADGKVFLVGRPQVSAALPAQVRQVAGRVGTTVSTEGRLLIDHAVPDDLQRRTQNPLSPADPDRPQAVTIDATASGTGHRLHFHVDPAARTSEHEAQGSAASPSLTRSGTAKVRPAVSGSATDPVDADRTCAVPRNDARSQVYQPDWHQVQWAVDLAVHDQLTVQRPANWHQSGLPAWRPQTMFAGPSLTGGGSVPAQVMLGILAQESNLWQASYHALEGEYGNPLVADFYGIPFDVSDDDSAWQIDFASADCGYGVGQVTDGMRLVGTSPTDKQRAVALDYATNIAAALQILKQKWNESHSVGINGQNPANIEAWFGAVWAYNSGFHPYVDAGTPWGLGWANNPVNPIYPANRESFLDDYDDAKTPNLWPYPERVMGWAVHPIQKDGNDAYMPGFWGSAPGSANVKPPVDAFCNGTANQCAPGTSNPNDLGDPDGPCTRRDLQCWWHTPMTWRGDCSTCGHEILAYQSGAAEPAAPNTYPPDCDRTKLPSNAVIVDDVPDSVGPVRCGKTWTSQGSFGLDFGADPDTGLFTSKIDFHQVGGGFGSHVWFAHTRSQKPEDQRFTVTGTWRPPSSVSGWTRVKVHVPSHGAWTRQANYVINLGNGGTRHRVVNQVWQAETWIDLGVFQLASGASVSLNNDTPDALNEDISFDAVAFIPTVKPQVSYVALGDSYSSGEGNEPYDGNSHYEFSDDFSDHTATDHCNRSASSAYPRQVRQPGHSQTIAQEAAAGAGTTSFAFIACSGAIMPSVTNDAVDAPGQNSGENVDWKEPNWHYGEYTQVDQGWLDQDTTLVTLTIGGDDARFGDVVRECGESLLNECSGDDWYLVHDNRNDPQPLKDYEPHILTDLLGPKLAATYRAIAAKAPNARIIVLTYPKLFTDIYVPITEPGLCAAFRPEVWDMLNHFGDLLAQTIKSTVITLQNAHVHVEYIDTDPAFAAHRACPHLTNSWINAVTIFPGFDGSPFHPNPDGQAGFASLINARLNGTG